MGPWDLKGSDVTKHARLYIGCYHPSVIFSLLIISSAFSGHFKMAVC